MQVFGATRLSLDSQPVATAPVLWISSHFNSMTSGARVLPIMQHAELGVVWEDRRDCPPSRPTLDLIVVWRYVLGGGVGGI